MGWEDAIFRITPLAIAIIDCFCILADARIKRYIELGCEVKGMERGHIRRLKEELRRESARS